MEEEGNNVTLWSVYRLWKKLDNTMVWLLWIFQLSKEETVQENWKYDMYIQYHSKATLHSQAISRKHLLKLSEYLPENVTLDRAW